MPSCHLSLFGEISHLSTKSPSHSERKLTFVPLILLIPCLVKLRGNNLFSQFWIRNLPQDVFQFLLTIKAKNNQIATPSYMHVPLISFPNYIR